MGNSIDVNFQTIRLKLGNQWNTLGLTCHHLYEIRLEENTDIFMDMPNLLDYQETVKSHKVTIKAVTNRRTWDHRQKASRRFWLCPSANAKMHLVRADEFFALSGTRTSAECGQHLALDRSFDWALVDVPPKKGIPKLCRFSHFIVSMRFCTIYPNDWYTWSASRDAQLRDVIALYHPPFFGGSSPD